MMPGYYFVIDITAKPQVCYKYVLTIWATEKLQRNKIHQILSLCVQFGHIVTKTYSTKCQQKEPMLQICYMYDQWELNIRFPLQNII